MNSADSDSNSGIKSELLDLSTVRLRELRTLDDTPFQEALHHVADRTSRVRVIARSNGGGGGERVD